MHRIRDIFKKMLVFIMLFAICHLEAAVQIQIRRDTAANWTSADPTLAEGEFGYETDTGYLKIGDGATAWTSLPYVDFGAVSSVSSGDSIVVVTPTTGDVVITIDETAIDHDNLTNTHNLTTDIDHNALTNYDANRHFLQSDISVTSGQVSDFDSAVTAIVEGYGYLTTETDPVYSAWDKSTGITITSGQVSDFDASVTALIEGYGYITGIAHNDTTSKQGGTTAEYYHLTNAQHTDATQLSDATHTGLLSGTDWSTFNGKQVGHANLTSLAGLSYASASFVKMTGANTFSLDTNTYLTGNQTITLSGAVSGAGTTSITTTQASAIIFKIDGAGSAIATGAKAWVRIPYACTLTGWYLTADASTTTTIDVWKDTYANFPPDNSDSITNSHEPAISADTKNSDTDISDWSSVAVAAGDYIRINVDANNNATYLELEITITR